MTGRLLVYGAGGHGKVVADAALAAGFHLVGFGDDDPARADQRVLALPVCAIGLSDTARYCRDNDCHSVIAIGNNRVRARVFRALRDLGVAMATVIHPRAVVAASATVGHGTVVFANAVVNPMARVGENAIVNTAAAIDHDCTVGDHTHLAPGARTGGTVRIGEGTMLGIGACVRESTDIGAWSMIGMGSVVVGDLPDRVVAFGNPATIRRPNN